jgi:putative PEP-CTERM system histidine kinase
MDVFLTSLAACWCCGLAIVMLLQNAPSLANRTFALGMASLAVEAVCRALSLQASSYAEVLHWQFWRFLATAMLPGIWLMFSLSFARAQPRESLKAWRWSLATIWLCALALVVGAREDFFYDLPTLEVIPRWIVGFGWAGYSFQVLFLLSAVLILNNLEKTLRASTGSLRSRIKFMILGIGSLFAVRVYTASQAVLFSSLNSTLEEINNGALVVAVGMLSVAVVRFRQSQVELQLSPTFLYNSLAVVVVGVYLVVVGGLAEFVRDVGGQQALFFEVSFVFLALLGFVIICLSDRVRLLFRGFISHHLRRPRYDYRAQWMNFTEMTTSLLDVSSLCRVVTTMVSETLGVSSVTIWLLDEDKERLLYGGSTVFSEAQAEELACAKQKMGSFIRCVHEHERLVDIEEEKVALVLPAYPSAMWQEAKIRYCVPLCGGGAYLGILTLYQRPTNESLSLEDGELLKTIADQTASVLLHLSLSRQFAKAKELEAFQTLSTFFVHDLKNLASTLSLTVQNLPVYYDNPEFRADALRVITNSVEKINSMCGRLSQLGRTLEIRPVETELPIFVQATLADLNGALQSRLSLDLRTAPPVRIDAEQMEKVLVNLVLNAQEAAGPQGEIRVSTYKVDGWATLAVKDNGCGMSADFLKTSWFQPFRTTKSKGLGIGLFQSRRIVEAHKGKIEVESEPGKGSTFRIMLPAQ